MKIALKLLLVMLAASLLPLVSIGFASLIISQHALQGQIQARINNTAQHQLERINALVQQADTQLNDLEYKAQLRLLLQAYEQTPNPLIQASIEQSLLSIVNSDQVFHGAFVTDNHGLVVAATDQSMVGQNKRASVLFQTAKKTPTINLFFHNSQGEIEQYIAAPLIIANQELGIAVVDASAAPYLTIVKDHSELGSTGESYLAQQLSNHTWQYLTPLRFAPNLALTTTHHSPFDKTDYLNHAVLVAAKPVPGTNWTLGVKIDTAEVEAPLLYVRAILVLILVLAALVTTLGAWYLSRFITIPIKRMTQVVTKIRNGDLSLNVDVHSKDEMGILGTAFNDMKNSLVATEARLTASLGSLPFGFAIIDNQNRLMFHNQALEQLTNRSLPATSETSPKAVAEISADLETADILGSLQQAQAKKAIIEKDVEFGPKFFRLLFVPVISSTNEVVGSVLILEDTTDKKALERSRDEFFSIASHELRTPLTAIRGNTSMILEYYNDQLKDPSLKEMVTDIHDSSTRLIDVVNDFLDTSRLEQGRAVFKKEPCDVVDIISQTIREYEVTGSRRKLYLRFGPPHDKLPQVFVDRDRMRQILVNLVGNGIKFTDTGGVTLTASPAGTQFVKVSVTDTGKGIPLTSQHLLFRKFQQASNNILTRDNTQSTGLGLYISKMLAEGMGGKLYLEKTAEGKGTTFSLELPVASSANTPSKQPPVPQPALPGPTEAAPQSAAQAHRQE